MDGKLDYKEGTVLMNHPANSVYQQVALSPIFVLLPASKLIRKSAGYRTHQGELLPDISFKVNTLFYGLYSSLI